MQLHRNRRCIGFRALHLRAALEQRVQLLSGSPFYDRYIHLVQTLSSPQWPSRVVRQVGGCTFSGKASRRSSSHLRTLRFEKSASKHRRVAEEIPRAISFALLHCPLKRDRRFYRPTDPYPISADVLSRPLPFVCLRIVKRPACCFPSPINEPPSCKTPRNAPLFASVWRSNVLRATLPFTSRGSQAPATNCRRNAGSSTFGQRETRTESPGIIDPRRIDVGKFTRSQHTLRSILTQHVLLLSAITPYPQTDGYSWRARHEAVTYYGLWIPVSDFFARNINSVIKFVLGTFIRASGGTKNTKSVQN